MKRQRNISGITSGKWYYGFITNWYSVNSKLRVCVELDDDPGMKYKKVIPIDYSPNSWFLSFARQMDIIDESGRVDLGLLKGTAVKVILRRVKNGKLYVNTMLIDRKYYEESEESDEEYE